MHWSVCCGNRCLRSSNLAGYEDVNDAEALKTATIRAKCAGLSASKAAQGLCGFTTEKDWPDGKTVRDAIRVQGMLPQKNLVERNARPQGLSEPVDRYRPWSESPLSEVDHQPTWIRASNSELFDPSWNRRTASGTATLRLHLLSSRCSCSTSSARSDQLTLHTRIKFYERDVYVALKFNIVHSRRRLPESVFKQRSSCGIRARFCVISFPSR